jgi:hypothetical protein
MPHCIVEPHQHREHRGEEDGAPGAPAGHASLQRAVEPSGAQIDGERTDADSEQRQRDGQEAEVVGQDRGEDACQGDLKRERAAGDEPDGEEHTERRALVHGAPT